MSTKQTKSPNPNERRHYPRIRVGNLMKLIDEKAPVQEKLDGLKTLLEDDNASSDDLKTATNALMESAQIIGQKLYEASQAEAAAAESEGEQPSDDDEVIEAEVIEEDE